MPDVMWIKVQHHSGADKRGVMHNATAFWCLLCPQHPIFFIENGMTFDIDAHLGRHLATDTHRQHRDLWFAYCDTNGYNPATTYPDEFKDWLP
jgi:hypothetical protein